MWTYRLKWNFIQFIGFLVCEGIFKILYLYIFFIPMYYYTYSLYNYIEITCPTSARPMYGRIF